MIKVHNDTTNGYFIMMTLPYMDEIIIITIVLAIWVFSIMQFFRQWSEWLIPAPSCEPFYWSENRETDSNYDNSNHSLEKVKLYQPWKFPSLVSLPLPPQRAGNFLRVPEARLQGMRSPSLPLFVQTRRQSRSRSNFLSTRSDSEPTMCLSLTPMSAKRPSIVLTRASVEREGEGEGERRDSSLYQSIGSRLPSHLSLGSSNFVPTPAPTSPLSLFLDDKQWPDSAARSVTPVLFPEHQLQVPNSKARSSHVGGLSRSGHFPSFSNWNLSSSSSPRGDRQAMIRSPSLSAQPCVREKQVLNTVINMWSKQPSLESRV